jgi:hypothetical protein
MLNKKDFEEQIEKENDILEDVSVDLRKGNEYN